MGTTTALPFKYFLYSVSYDVTDVHDPVLVSVNVVLHTGIKHQYLCVSYLLNGGTHLFSI
jgi:hypothetical protein